MLGKRARPSTFLTTAERARVQAAIAAAERNTSGEIRVVLSRRAKGDALAAAKSYFHRLRMHETPERNAVLLFIATKTRQFAILGDREIHQKVGQHGWDRTRDAMAERFARGDFEGGLIHAVEEVGKVLQACFPCGESKSNHLRDEVVED